MSALKLSGAEIRQAFLDFYSLAGTSAVAEWFIGAGRSDGVIDDSPGGEARGNAGMLPFKPIFLGQHR